jgi:phage terminase large subunit-like protein
MAHPDLGVGFVRPRVASWPPGDGSKGLAAVELARKAGLVLDGWQQHVLVNAMRTRNDRWSAFEVGIVVPRQNGKGAILEARELAQLFLLDKQFIIHSAHQFDTSLEAFRRLLTLVEETPELACQVLRKSRSHGEEGIELKNGSRIRFRTRTKGGGRGFSANLVIFDEAMFFDEYAHGSLMPTMSAATDPQVLYAGSAVDEDVHDHGVVFARIRERGLRGDDPSLAYFEWSLPIDDPSLVSDEVATDATMWAESNPALGIRIPAEHVAHERVSMEPRAFAVERLNVGAWPRTDGALSTVINLEEWLALADSGSEALDPVCFAFDVSPDRSAAISAAGRRPDGLWHVEVVQHRTGTGWLPGRLVELVEKHEPAVVVCDGYGPSASLIHEVEEAGVVVETTTASVHAQACGRLVDAVSEQTVRHLGSQELLAAIRGARTRPLGDAWAWSRRSSNVNICPLVASTLALSAAMDQPEDTEMRIY